MAELFAAPLLLDVGIGAKPADDLAAFIADRLGARKKPAIFAVRAAYQERVFPDDARFDAVLEVLRHPIDFIRVLDTFPAPALHVTKIRVRVIEPPLIIPKDIALGVHDPRQLRNGFCECVKLPFAFA